MGKANILVCDDERGVRESLKMILEKDYTLVYATNGQEALDYVKTHDPALVIMDVKMPRMSGLEALRQMKMVKPNIRVFIITGYEASDVATEAINLGADDYLVKPFERQKVQAQVSAILSR